MADRMKRRFQDNPHRGFTNDLGMNLTVPEKGMAIGSMKIEDRMLNPYGAIHGGVLFSLADTVGGTAALSRGFYIVTSTGTIHYLRDTSKSREITATAIEVKSGKTLSIYDVEMEDEHGKVVAKATMTYFSTGVAVENLDELNY